MHDGYPSVETIEEIKPSMPCFASGERGDNARAIEVIDLRCPINTALDDFELFEKWSSYASNPRFETVVEMYVPPASVPYRSLLENDYRLSS